MPNGNNISRETFVSYWSKGDPVAQGEILFDFLSGLRNQDTVRAGMCAERIERCNRRFQRLELNWAKLTGIGSIVGIVVGVGLFLMEKLIA